MTSVSVIGSSFVLLTAALSVVGISVPDYYAIVGMAAAQVIVLVAIRQMQKSFGASVSAFIGTLIGGVALPGLIINALIGWEWISPEFHLLKYWHTWVMLGFISGMAGWPLASTVYQFCQTVLPQSLKDWLSDKFSKKS